MEEVARMKELPQERIGELDALIGWIDAELDEIGR